MHLTTDFKEIGNISKEMLTDALAVCLSTDWSSDEFTRPEVTLAKGRVVVLPYIIVKPEQRNYSEAQNKIIDSVTPIIKYLDSLFPNCIKVRGEVVNLLPKTSLTPHIDPYWFHEHSHRIHVPIYTNNECGQTFEDRVKKLDAGVIYEINNRLMHSAFNNSDLPRIHLIIDYMPIDKVKEASSNPNLYLSK